MRAVSRLLSRSRLSAAVKAGVVAPIACKDQAHFSTSCLGAHDPYIVVHTVVIACLHVCMQPDYACVSQHAQPEDAKPLLHIILHALSWTMHEHTCEKETGMNLSDTFPNTTDMAKTAASRETLISCLLDCMLFLGTYCVVLKAVLRMTQANM